jgi:beta-lactamase class A
MRRDAFLSSTLASLSIFVSPLRTLADDGVAEKLAKLEAGTGGRLGVVALDTGGARTISHRGNERFPMCSTFKFLAVAAALTRVDHGQEHLKRRVSYGPSDILEYAPIAKKHLNDGFMTIGTLCEAAIEYSDNTAANLLLSTIGGPAGVTHYARTLGDPFTRLDRTEPALNAAIPGDVRDTTTPEAMAKNIRKILLTNALSRASRNQLDAWLIGCRTGTDLLRAGVPPSWRVGDKTGMGGSHNRAGDSDTRNDIAILWPGRRPPIIIAAYLTGSNLPAAKRDAAIASVGNIVATAFA